MSTTPRAVVLSFWIAIALNVHASGGPGGLLENPDSSPPPPKTPVVRAISGAASPWTHLSAWVSEEIVAWDERLVVSFADNRGLWLYEAGEWAPLTPSNPYAMMVHCDRLFAAFVSSGIWSYDESDGWENLSPAEPARLVAAGTKLAADFGVHGLWEYDCEPPVEPQTLTLLASPATASPFPELDPTEQTYFSMIFGQLLGASAPLVGQNITFFTDGGILSPCSSPASCSDPVPGPVTVTTDAAGVVHLRLAVTAADPATINIEASAGTIFGLVTVNNPLGGVNHEPSAAIRAIPESPVFVNQAGFATVIFTSESTDPDDDPITCYSWRILSDAGIGYEPQIGPHSTYTKDFAVEDEMLVILKVTDDPDAAVQCDEQTIFSPNVAGLEYLVCTNNPPTAEIVITEEDDTQLGVYTITAGGDASYDPENTQLSYSWDCGNGQTSTQSAVTCEYVRGTVTRFFTIELTVTDRGAGEQECALSDTDSLTVQVTPLPGG